MNRESDRFQMTKELGQKLRELRERAGLTQTDLAPDRLDRQLRRKQRGRPSSDSCLGLRQRELPPFGTPDREKRERRSRSPKLSPAAEIPGSKSPAPRT